MSEATKTLPIVVRIPERLGLTPQQATRLEEKWLHDLVTVVTGSNDQTQAKIKFHITIHIEIGNDDD